MNIEGPAAASSDPNKTFARHPRICVVAGAESKGSPMAVSKNQGPIRKPSHMRS